MHSNIRKLAMGFACVVALTIGTGPVALAQVSPTTGQPGAPTNTCGPANMVTPGSSAPTGGAAAAAGSPFNQNGQAGLVYAGNPQTASLAHSNSTAAVSQYDTACVRLSH